MTESPFEMRFDPRTIHHLGVRMYSTLPPALAELVSNSYDADAGHVDIVLAETNGQPSEIRVIDDGVGLSAAEVNDKFLVIGRNRRDEEGDQPSARFQRMPTGKKGLGKLALFGLANTITIETVQNGRSSAFVLDWDALCQARGAYRPTALQVDRPVDADDGTRISLTGLKRTSAFNAEDLADSLSRLFRLDGSLELAIVSPKGERVVVDNMRKYSTITPEFEWQVDDSLVPEGSRYAGKVCGQFMTSEKPLTPQSGLRGITLYSRGKLVNAPEFFSSSTSSHFYQYLTGWVSVDFIDGLEEDVISTNRQSIDWGHPEMAQLREFLAGMVSKINADWRLKRQAKKREGLEAATGIDTEAWVRTLPSGVKESAQTIIDSLGGEDALESFTPVIRALHSIIPEYPQLHWRHLHPELRERMREYYANQQFGVAADQGTRIYCEVLRRMTGSPADGRDLVNPIFGSPPYNTLPNIQLNDLVTDSERNIQEGQGHLSRGVVVGFRNPMAHAPADTAVPGVFSELDCLNILSTLSYLLARLDGASVNPGLS